MNVTNFDRLTEKIKLRVLRKLDFSSLLSSRLVCIEWNEFISCEILPNRSRLHVQIDESKVCKKFIRGKWTENVLGIWKELIIHYPSRSPFSLSISEDSIFSWGKKSCFLPFGGVQKLKIFETGRDHPTLLLDFVHSILVGMPNLRYFAVRSHHNKDGRRRFLTRQIIRLYTELPSWRIGLKHLGNITTFRISGHELATCVLFIQLVSHAKPPLTVLEFDFSKLYGLPLKSLTIDEIYTLVSQLIVNCSGTLENLRLKWDHRVEHDLELVDYSRDIDPFIQFILMLSSSPSDFQSLRLKMLILSFPIVSFFSSELIDVAFVPFLKSQVTTLERFYISRVRWDRAAHSFLNKFDNKFQNKIEMGVFMLDIDVWTNGRLRLSKAVRMVEFHSLASRTFDLNAIHARKARSRRTGAIRWKRQIMTSLRFRNSPSNSQLAPVNLREIFHYFHHLQDLELIDHSGQSEGRQFSQLEFNNIFIMLPKLKSLKMTNLLLITDAGLTSVPNFKLKNMYEKGVYFPNPPLSSIPIIQAKCLRHLELRDLSSSVSDVSIFFAIQFIPRLQRVALYGSHQITAWGHHVLFRRFSRNPLFQAEINLFKDPTKSYVEDFP